MRASANKLLIAAISLAVLIAFSAIGFSIFETQNVDRDTGRIAHSEEILIHLTNTLSLTTDGETATRGFIITGQKEFLQPQDRTKKIIFQELSTLKDLYKTNFQTQRQLDSIGSLIKQKILWSDSTVQVRKTLGLAPAVNIVASGQGKGYMDQIRILINRIIVQENINLQLAQRDSIHSINLRKMVLLSAILFILFLVILVFRKAQVDMNSIKIVARQLQESEERYRLLVGSVKDYAIFMVDPAGYIESWNEGASRIKGYEADEILRKHISIFYTTEDIHKGEPENNLKQAREKGSYEAEGWRVRKDGTSFWANVVFTALLDDNGQFQGFTKVTRDITVRKQLEDKLKKFNKELELQVREKTREITEIFERITDGFVAFSDGWICTYVNRQGAEMFHLPMEQIIGKDFRELFPKGFGTVFNQTVEWASLRQEVAHFEDYLQELDSWYQFDVYPSSNGVSVFFKNVTEKKKSEQLLFEKEEQMRLFVEHSPAALAMLDKDLKYLMVSNRWCADFKLQAESIIGKCHYDIFPEIPQRWRKIHQVCLNGAVEKDEEDSFVRPDGTLDWLRWEVRPWHRANGIIGGIIIFSELITDRINADNLIRREREFSDTIIDRLPGIFYMVDDHLKFIRCNKNFETLTGYSHQEILNMSPLDFYDEGDKSRVEDRIKVLLEGNSPGAEVNLLTKDKRKIPFYVNSWVLNLDGKDYLIGIGTDLTERKKTEEELIISEKKYKLLFDANPMPMLMIDLESYQFVDVNNSAVQHYGYSKNEFLGLNIFSIRPPEDVDALRVELKRNSPEVSNRGVWRHIRKDGSLIKVEAFSFDFNFEGRGIRLLLVNDVTEKMAAEEKLKKSYTDIRQLASHLQEVREEERAALAREVHDELGQQITGLKMDISSIAKKMSKEDSDQKARIKGVMELLDDTVRTIRKISSDLRPSILDDLGIVEAIEWHSREFQKRSGIVVNFLPKIGPSEISKSQSVALFRIYQESLTNVARHAQATIVNTTLEKSNSHVVLNIQDNGVGFELSNIRHKKTLGLLGMRERTLMLGGVYDIKSNPGEGTLVSVMVPLNGQVPL